MKTEIITILLPGLLAVSGCGTYPIEPVFNNHVDEKGDSYQAIASISLSNGSILTSRDVTLSWEGTSAVKDGYEYSLDGKTFVPTIDTTLSQTDLEEGLHTFVIKPLNVNNDTTITFTVNTVTGPGIVFSPRKITSTGTVSLILENVENFMGAHIEIVCNDGCVGFGEFSLSDDAKDENKYHMIRYFTVIGTEETSRIVIDLGCLRENGFTGSMNVGSITVDLKAMGEIHIDSDKTFFRNLDNTNIELNGYDFVRVVQ